MIKLQQVNFRFAIPAWGQQIVAGSDIILEFDPGLRAVTCKNPWDERMLVPLENVLYMRVAAEPPHLPTEPEPEPIVLARNQCPDCNKICVNLGAHRNKAHGYKKP